MTDQLAQSKGKAHVASVQPFEIEFDNGNSGDLFLQTTCEKYRGAWSRQKLGTRTRGLPKHLAIMPDIPGMRMRITPKTNELYIYDPLWKDPEAVATIERVKSGSPMGFSGTFKAVEPRTKPIDKDRMVTLLWELRRSFDAGAQMFNIVSGQLPTPDQIDSLPGDELNDVGDASKTKAKYRKDRDQNQKILAAMREAGVMV